MNFDQNNINPTLESTTTEMGLLSGLDEILQAYQKRGHEVCDLRHELSENGNNIKEFC